MQNLASSYCIRHTIRACFLLFAVLLGIVYYENAHHEDKVASGWKPWLCARLLTAAEQHNMLDNEKKELLEDVTGVVMEIGCGSGQNFKFYGSGVTKVIAVEPNMEMYPFIEDSKRTLAPSVDFELVPAIAQELSNIPDESVDAVIAFHVLCTISDVKTALDEAYRVLKRLEYFTNGKFVFLEHVVDEDATSFRSTLQHLITPVWRVIGDGCYPNRPTWLAIQDRFEDTSFEYFEANVVTTIIQPHIKGTAHKQ